MKRKLRSNDDADTYGHTLTYDNIDLEKTFSGNIDIIQRLTFSLYATKWN